ncbi:MAG: hypothetical protein RIS54_1518 [Verrucomicrobiota bacterium]|jgi:hypothetical protein
MIGREINTKESQTPAKISNQVVNPDYHSVEVPANRGISLGGENSYHRR